MKVRLESSGELGTTVRSIRERLGKSLSEVARVAGISKAYLSQIERGKFKNPTVELLGRIAKALEIELVIQGNPSRKLSETLTYRSDFTLQEPDGQGAKGSSAVQLLSKTLSDPEIPEHYKSLLERQVSALVKTLKEELKESSS